MPATYYPATAPPCTPPRRLATASASASRPASGSPPPSATATATFAGSKGDNDDAIIAALAELVGMTWPTDEGRYNPGMDSIWPSLIGTLTGGAIAIMGSIIAQTLASKSDHEKHKREIRSRHFERVSAIFEDVLAWGLSLQDRVAKRGLRQGNHDELAAIMARVNLHADITIIECLGKVASIAVEMNNSGPYRHTDAITDEQRDLRIAWLRDNGFTLKLENAFLELAKAMRSNLLQFQVIEAAS